ncbi:hypothetical protein A1O7_07813 [Cladophialophora yegresii CBS 114405]|uniref:NAD(P)-binding domain-containing protein n=1 Tax=Cladophialophora yegresii CBS 114405 TaxID=1182544 RepID=W9VXN5_9EURO|nr:uncharacterized protein A1O7_07813 [Cladophialophora yegresii CBS 114405]EXJ57465.1 hypothetical protein A1O7_07813 [Cladophialophora yegresii CBS 114405]
MKLLIVGGTGFVATEIIRQSLASPEITSVVTLARRPVEVPQNLGGHVGPSKLKSVLLQDFTKYSEDVKAQLENVDACIWTLAITPTKAKSMPWDEVVKVCREYTMTGLQAIVEARRRGSARSTPLRFLYMSGESAERDQTKTPRLMTQYLLMRGETENQILAFAASHPDQVEVTVAKPGLILEPGNVLHWLKSWLLWAVVSLPSITVVEIAAAMLDQVMNGFEKDPLLNEDLVRIGQKALNGTEPSS